MSLSRQEYRLLKKTAALELNFMKSTGHKTASVYRRYRIVSEDDIRAALLKTETAATDATSTVVPLRKAVAR